MSNVPGPRMRDKPGDGKDRLAKLDQQIAEARKVDTPKPRGEKDKYAAMSMAWRITIELVVSIVIGAAMGWGLDALFGSLPIFLVVFTLLGFAAGIRTIMRTAEEEQRKNVAKKAADESNAAKPAKDESNAAKPAKDESNAAKPAKDE